MKKNVVKAALALALVSLFLLAGCGQPAGTTSGDTPANVVIKVGASPTPHAEILEQVIPILAEQGITLEIVEFNDYVVPNTALEDGSLDANYFQTQPYLTAFNADHGTHIVGIADIHYEPLGVYPGKTASFDELPDGAQIGIPNDATNEGRALQLLVAQGLITLREGVGLEAVPNDVIDNPKNIQFVELEPAQLPVSLPDLDMAVINGNYALGAGIASTGIAYEAPGSEGVFPNLVCVREGDEQRPEILALVEAIMSDAIRDFINDRYEGIVVPLF